MIDNKWIMNKPKPTLIEGGVGTKGFITDFKIALERMKSTDTQLRYIKCPPNVRPPMPWEAPDVWIEGWPYVILNDDNIEFITSDNSND